MNTAVNYRGYHSNTYKRNTALRKSRKAIAMRKRTLFVAITVVAILLGIVLGNNVISSSHSSAYSTVEKELYYTSVEVKAGDTLWTIAEEYMCAEFDDMNSYIKEIKRINNMHSDTIHAGGYIMVPYYEVVE